jgi:hypothetical protein
MSTITDRGAMLLLCIDVFEVAPERQSELVHVLETAAKQTMKRLSGFVASNTYRTVDGARIVNCTQWTDRPAFEAMQSNLEMKQVAQQTIALAKVQPIVCEPLAAGANPGPGETEEIESPPSTRRCGKGRQQETQDVKHALSDVVTAPSAPPANDSGRPGW